MAQAAFQGAWCLLQTEMHLCGAGDLQEPPPKSLKAVGRTGSQLPPAIAWKVEFLDTGSKDPDEPGCALWYNSE